MGPEQYAAFFRGINVGGKGAVKMSQLKRELEGIQLKNVRPVLASGNVVFETTPTQPDQLKTRIEGLMAERFSLSSAVFLRTCEEIGNLLAANPFTSLKLGPQVKVQVTFLEHELKTTGKLPVSLLFKPFRLVQVSSREICSALDMSGKARTPELMKYLEKEFGKELTTRTWATVEKIGEILGFNITRRE